MPGWRATSAVSARIEAGTIASVVRSPARPRSSSSAARTTARASASEGTRGSWLRLRWRGVEGRWAAARRGRSRRVPVSSTRCTSRRAQAGEGCGKSARQWPPRLSSRASAAVAISSATRAGSAAAPPRKASGCRCATAASRPARSRTTPKRLARPRRAQRTRVGRGRQCHRPRRGQRTAGSCRRCCRPRSARHHHRLEQRVAGQPVGAVQAARRHLAAGPQAFDRAAALASPRRCRPCGSAPPAAPGSAGSRDRCRRRGSAR